MIDYGNGPAPDEIEVTLFGPGYGEAIAIHLGEQHWILVDSCIDPDARLPATQAYLTQIGVRADQVRVIVASHWHDDHVRGISKLAASFPAAEFVLSTTFNSREACQFLAAYSGAIAPGQTAGTKELYDVVTQRKSVCHAHQRTTIYEIGLSKYRATVSALSPVNNAVSQSIAYMAQYLPPITGGTPINHAPDLRPNFESIVIHINVGEDAILLGSDMEDHKSYGWSAVAADTWCRSRTRASAYKAAHHGSYTGDSPAVWATLLTHAPTVCMTPYNLGGSRLPTEEDKARTKQHTPHAYISSGATRKPDLHGSQLKRLEDICTNLTRANSGFGAVRLRKRFGQSAWQVECFGNAQRL